MDAKPGSSSQGSDPDPGESDVESYGPLELRRLRKDDGRALIAYQRREPPEPAATP
jgi:hypothetical protein